jgi:hypothetical protein
MNLAQVRTFFFVAASGVYEYAQQFVLRSAGLSYSTIEIPNAKPYGR